MFDVRLRREHSAVVVWDLNDGHRWTREQIADWVQTIEEQQLVPCAAPSVETVESSK